MKKTDKIETAKASKAPLESKSLPHGTATAPLDIKKMSPENQTKALKIMENYIEWLRFPTSRPIATVDTGNNEYSSMPNWERVRSISEARQLAQNSVAVISFLEAFKNHAIDDSGDVVFNTPNKRWNDKAQKLMRKANRDVDYRVPRTTISTYLKVAVESIIRDGDFTVIVDEDITDNKFLTYEADQVCAINDNQWKIHAPELGYTYKDSLGNVVPCKQHSGIITDGFGKVRAVVCTNIRGQTTIDIKDATIFPINIVNIVMKSSRFSQYRGNSMLLAMLTVIADFSDLIQAEIQSAKRQAVESILVRQDNPVEQFLTSMNMTQDQLTEGTGVAMNPTTPQRYDNLENIYGGGVVYASKQDEVTHLKNERPNQEISQFENYMKQSCGGSLGLYKMFSTLEVSTSFSAARAELHLTWAAFRAFQKILEESVLRFRNEKLIESWVSRGLLPAIPGDIDACETYVVEWSRPPELSPLDEVNASLAKIRGGLSNWDIENGADNEKIQTRLAENVKFLKDNGLDMLSFFETKAGAPIVPEKETEESEKPEETKVEKEDKE